MGILDKSRCIAAPGYNRYLVPLAALAVHLCIGQAYAFSALSLPMTRLLGISAAAPGDWSLAQVGWTFSIAIIFLGLSAAVFGRWVEQRGPRWAMFTAALLFSGGLAVCSLGIYLHALWLVYLGYGVIGGAGLGIGYISPVSTLMKWFPDRPGMATGLAIMGFGGGALIAAPVEVWLMSVFHTSTDVGVTGTLAVLGLLYLAVMSVGAALVRIPAPGWLPRGYTATAAVTGAGMDAGLAVRTSRFWLLWMVLCLNVTAGIGVLGQASPMIQEMFPGRVTPAQAAGFISLLSLFNMGGRFFWSSVSDRIGRRATYSVFFLLGVLLYATVPSMGEIGSVGLFTAAFAVILSMYGGGFATIPAYLRDAFGTAQVGAIHGRLLTAWSVAGVLGPMLVNYIRQYQLDHGASKPEAYSHTMYIMAGLLVVGLACNLMLPSRLPFQAAPRRPGSL